MPAFLPIVALFDGKILVGENVSTAVGFVAYASAAVFLICVCRALELHPVEEKQRVPLQMYVLAWAFVFCGGRCSHIRL
jgi:hypothetical protein